MAGEKFRKITRAQWLELAVFLVLAIFVGRLAQIQIFQGKFYAEKAAAMQTSKQQINATRGEIFVRDADGNLAPLVLNQTVYTMFADPTQVTDARKVEQVATEKLGAAHVLSGNFAQLTDKNTQYVVLARNVSYDATEAIQAADLAGVGFQRGTRRVYPEGALAAQALGYVNSDGKGQYGVEQFLDKDLAGKPGELNTVTDVRKIPLAIGTHDTSIPAQNGKNVVLSLDRNVQLQVEHDLADGLKSAKATSGSAIIMDPETGRILALASAPSYDPANLNSIVINKNLGVSTAEALAATNSYEPGSIMKLFTIAAGIDHGSITATTSFANTNCMQVYDAKICNVDKVPGPRNMMEILGYSLNVGAVWVLEQMGGGGNPPNLRAQTAFYDYLMKNYRFATKTGVEIAGEAGSVIHSPGDLAARGGAVTYANMAFGQGMQLTMVQVIAAFSAVINGGTYYQPTLILGSTDENGENLTEIAPKVVAQNAIAPQDSVAMVAMLRDARFLHAPGAKAVDNGYYCGGKSGTAQKIDPTTGKYSDTLTTGSYIGFCADATRKPKYAILVRVDDAHNGGYSGSAAAQPIFDNLSRFMTQYEGLSK